MSKIRDSYDVCEKFLEILDRLNITSDMQDSNIFVDTDEFFKVMTNIEVDDDE